MQQLIVTAAAILHEGCILVAQRKPGSHLALKWELPGGKLEWGEEPRAGLAREIREELGIEIEVLDVLDVVSHTYEDKHIVLIAYLCRYQGGTIERRDVHDYRFVRPDEILNLDLAPADVALVKRLLQHVQS